MFSKYSKYLKLQIGFTILELVVVMAIIVILIVLFLTNFRGFENKSALEGEADKISSVLKQAQVLSLTGQLAGSPPTRYSYGVRISECTSGSCTYILFGDFDDDKLYTLGEENIGGQIHNMLKGVYINPGSLQLGGSVTDLDIVFEPPLADVYFNGLQSFETATIILDHTIYNGQKTITINQISGQINIH